MSIQVAKRSSIVTSLTLVVTGIMVTAVLVGGGIALFEQQRQLMRALETKATTLAQFMGQVSPLSIMSLNFVEMNNDVKKVVLTDDEAAYAVILNEHGIPLANFFKASDPLVTGQARDLVAAKKPLAALEALKQTGRVLEVKTPIFAGERHIGSAILGFSTAKMRRALLTQIIVIGIALAIINGAGIILLRLVLRRMLRPVRALTTAATQISAGDLNVVLTGTNRTDELGVLARTFGSMAEQLRESIAGMEQREHDLRLLTSFQRIILDNAAYGIISTSPDGVVTSFNPAAERFLGYSAGEVVGKQTPAIWHDPEEVARRARDLSAELGTEVAPGFEVFVARARRNLPDECEWSLIRKDGVRLPALLSVTALRDENGQITGFLGMVGDLTERKRTEEQLKRYRDHLEDEVQQRTADLVLARNAAEAANQAKSTFLANMSHEFRTPLNAILGFSTMVRKDPLLPPSLQQNLDIINRSGEHLLTLINDVLEMAKIESGRVQLENAPFDLGSMVRDVTDMMEMRAREKGLKLQIDQSSRFPRYVVGDEARLRQVIINLVGNALKFTQEGGVTVRLGKKENKIAHLRIEVEDSGPGIAAEDRQRIFEPFVQLGEQGLSKGTGLGLTITRQFVQMMGGSIGLESTPGKGALFRVDLPLTEASEADIVKPQRTGLGDVVGLAPGQPSYRILIVEDQRDNQLLLSKLMQAVEFQVKVAENGEQGVQKFQSWHPDFIWMDRRMPVMDGIEATRRIRATPGGKEVKIVAVTASAFSEQRAEMLEAGMDDFVRKPFRASEIYDCLSKHLGVKFLYEGVAASEEAAVTLTPEMLSALPEALRKDLRDALKSLKSELIDRVVQQVGAYDRQLQNTLTRLADNFDYPSMLRALGEK